MTILKDVIAELFGMFVGDLRLSLSILFIVAGTAVLGEIDGVTSLAAGSFLLLGVIAVLIENVAARARQTGD